MNNVLSIRNRLGLSQAAFGAAIQVSQGSISHYEKQTYDPPPDVARQIIAAAKKKGVAVTFNDIYAPPARARRPKSKDGTPAERRTGIQRRSGIERRGSKQSDESDQA